MKKIPLHHYSRGVHFSSEARQYMPYIYILIFHILESVNSKI